MLPSDRATPRPSAWPAAVVALAFAIAFLIGTKGHGTFDAQPIKWADWYDQGQYWKSAEAFARGSLAASDHWYPLLYSLLLAPFTFLPDGWAALLPNLALYVATWFGFARVARHFGLSRWPACALFVATTVAYPLIGKQWVIPWTTAPSAALIWLALAQMAAILTGEPSARPARRAFLTGLLLGAIPLVRPADAVVSALIGAELLKPWLLDRRDWRALGALAAGGLAAILPYLALHLAIYGPLPSDYMRMSALYGIELSRLPWKAYLLLVEPRPWFPEGKGLLLACPWLIVGLAGMILGVVQRRHRLLAIGLCLPALAYAAIMLAYIDLLPGAFWRFNNVHYFKWLLPLFALFAWTFLRDARRSPRHAGVAFAPVFLISCLRVAPIPAPPSEPARLLVFPAATTSFDAIYFGQSTLVDARGMQRNIFDFRQTPLAANKISANSLRRDFAGDEQWFTQAPAGQWPLEQLGSRNPVGEPQAPTARYRPKVSFGYPCWLPPRPCPTQLPPWPGTPAGATGRN